jgi:2,4-dienoyl-CoA reductase-like NADH-dependent reductase (Old Yellow Enzyme family)
LDVRLGIDRDDSQVVLSDAELERIIDDYVTAAGVAQDVGFHFVDVKACHGYLLHETLSGFTRPGRFGGDFEGRTRMLREIVGRIRDAYPGLMTGERLSVFDLVPYEAGSDLGQPMRFESWIPYRYAFGVDHHNPLQIDLSEPIELMKVLADLGVVAINVTCGSPYYCPHAQRPAYYPPSDGYQPPEDPLLGVCRQIDVARQCKQALPNVCLVGSGYTYLQGFLPHVAQAVVRAGWIDAVGLGRMALSWPRLPADTLSKGEIDERHICRTFSDCTTAPRNGLVSGCFPLDAYYKSLIEAKELKRLKRKTG